MESKPKYFLYCFKTPFDRKAIITVQTWLGVFLLNTIAVLFELIHCPDAISYSDSSDCNFLVESTFALQNMILLSANNIWFMDGAPLQILIPEIKPFWDALDSRLINPSVRSKKR